MRRRRTTQYEPEGDIAAFIFSPGVSDEIYTPTSHGWHEGRNHAHRSSLARVYDQQHRQLAERNASPPPCLASRSASSRPDSIPIDGPIEVAPVPMDFHGPNTGIHVKIGQRGKEQYMFKGHLHITRDANLFQILSPMAYAFSFSKKVYGIFAVFLAFSHVLSLSIL